MFAAGYCRARCLDVILGLLCMSPLISAAQKTTDTRLEAAYIYNFAKFVEWPPYKFPNTSTPIRFCVLNDFAFQSELNRAVSAKTISGRTLEVVLLRDPSQALQCHVLFINAAQERQIEHLLKPLRGASVLTVGETDGFLDEGGMINFSLQNDQVQFRINHKAAQEANLYLSSRLLSLAKKVVE